MNTLELFEHTYNTQAEVIAKAPGRLEILGNHTDYNEGLVLSVAVDCHTEIAFREIEGTECKIYSPVINDGIRSFNLHDIDQPLEGKDWTNYIRGVIRELQKRDFQTKPFEAVITSTIPISAGMSSSASIEMALISGLCELFDFDIDLIEKARIGQGCENNYIGANTGLLDQLSSLAGKENHLIVSEYRHLNIDHTPIPSELTLVVVDSGVKHDLSCEYNERREMCEEARDKLKAAHPEIKALRDVSTTMLEAHKEHLSENAYKRARHITEENERVKLARQLLEKNKLTEFGQLLYDSHESSINNFENSCEELDFLVKVSKESGMCLGARLSGGGFGGISIHLIKSELSSKYVQFIKAAFEKRYKRIPEAYICRSADAASAYSVQRE
jgi:galactokinase